MFAQRQRREILAGEEPAGREEHVGVVTEIGLHVLLVVAGDQKSTVEILPSVVIHRPNEILDAGVDAKEREEITATNVNANPRHGHQRRRRIVQLRFEVVVRNGVFSVITQIQRDVPDS